MLTDVCVGLHPDLKLMVWFYSTNNKLDFTPVIRDCI